MADITDIANVTTICGRLNLKFTISHIARGEEFYTSEIVVPRKSGFNDVVPVMVSGRITDISSYKAGDTIFVKGQIRTLEKKELSKYPTYVYAEKLNKTDPPEDGVYINEVWLSGSIYKKGSLHTTQSGRAAISTKIMVTREYYDRSDYVPCVMWNDNARYIDKIKVGDIIKITGRLQSRVYQSPTEERQYVEVSVFQLRSNKLKITGTI